MRSSVSQATKLCTVWIMRLFVYLLTLACAAIVGGELASSHPDLTSSRGGELNNTASAYQDLPFSDLCTGPALAYDPDDAASPKLWNRYIIKGGALMCALRHSDQFAGDYPNDDRDLKSAASRWRGEFQRMLKSTSRKDMADPRQMTWPHGAGTNLGRRTRTASMIRAALTSFRRLFRVWDSVQVQSRAVAPTAATKFSTETQRRRIGTASISIAKINGTRLRAPGIG
jgi:hypothetical protein